MTRKFFTALVLTLALVLAVSGVATAQDDSPYAPYAGDTIVVSWPSLFHFQQAATLIPQFTEETGINVEVDFIQYQNMKTAQETELQKPRNGEYDVVAWVVFTKSEYVKNGYLTPLAEFFVDAELADPNYDAEDLVQAWVETGGVVGGHRAYLPGPAQALYGLPFGAETSILAYRTDIFEEYDLAVPETYEEMLETAAFITENVPDVYGMTSRGAAGHQVVHGYLLHLSPYGGLILNDDWNPMVTEPEAIAAAEALKVIIENSPPGVETYGFGEQANAFLQGDAAMYLDTHKIAAMSRDPNQSLIDGNVGYALHPRVGDAECGLSETGGFSMGIPANSANKEAAFLFMQWMTSKRIDRELALIGADPARVSTLSDPDLQEMFPEYPVVLEQLECANPDWRPLIPEWGALNAPILGVYIHEYITGEKTVEEAMAAADAEIREVMERAGYYTWASQ
jgi:multiple sugar transport system substrate-binding protein